MATIDILALIFLFVWIIAISLCVVAYRLCTTIDTLRDRLAQAMKNDMPRDPKTGRFYNPKKRGK